MPTSRRLSSPFRPALRLALIAVALALPLASPVQAGWFSTDPTYAGYRIPEHRWSYWTMNLHANGSHASAPVFSGLNREGSWSTGLGTRFGAAYDSDRLQHDWSFAIDASGGRSGSRLEEVNLPSTYERSELRRNLSQRIGGGGAVRTYPWPVPVGLRLALASSLDLSQRFTSSDVDLRNPFDRWEATISSGEGARRYQGTASAWLGLGHVRNAGPVHRAQVLEARLLETGALTRPLSGQARDRLAALYSVESGLNFAHERSAKYFWRELERILREDGALASGSLDAWSVQRLLERLSLGRSQSVTRWTGYFVGPSVSVTTVRDHRTRSDSYSNIQYVADTVWATTSDRRHSTVNTRLDDVFVSLGAEFHRPLDPRWQLDASSTFGIRESGEFPTFGNSLSLAYIVTDRWFGVVSASHSASGVGHSRRPDLWSAGLSAELVYFLEDAWALSLRGSEGQFRDAVGFRRNGGFSLGVTWIVSGFFAAPGIVGAMRPSPIP